MRVLLDTNILLRSAVSSEPEHASVNKSILQLLAQGAYLVITPQNLVEFWVALTRPKQSNGYGYSIEEAISMVEYLLNAFQLFPHLENQAESWFFLCRKYKVHGKQAHDTNLVAFMLEHGISRLLTLNTGNFTRYSEIICLSPDQI